MAISKEIRSKSTHFTVDLIIINKAQFMLESAIRIMFLHLNTSWTESSDMRWFYLTLSNGKKEEELANYPLYLKTKKKLVMAT